MIHHHHEHLQCPSMDLALDIRARPTPPQPLQGQLWQSAGSYIPHQQRGRSGDQNTQEESSSVSSVGVQQTYLWLDFATSQEGRAIPIVVAWGPSGLPYFSQFSRIASSVKLNYSATKPQRHLRVVCLGDSDEHFFSFRISDILIGVILEAELTVFFLDVFHTCTL